MRTTLTLADDVYEAARLVARDSGRSLGDVVSDLLRRSLSPAPVPNEAGLPMFHVAAGARVIPGDRAARLLADEEP